MQTSTISRTMNPARPQTPYRRSFAGVTRTALMPTTALKVPCIMAGTMTEPLFCLKYISIGVSSRQKTTIMKTPATGCWG